MEAVQAELAEPHDAPGERLVDRQVLRRLDQAVGAGAIDQEVGRADQHDGELQPADFGEAPGLEVISAQLEVLEEREGQDALARVQGLALVHAGAASAPVSSAPPRRLLPSDATRLCRGAAA